MAKGANVSSVASVQELLVALLNFWPRCQELLDDVESAGTCGLTELESRQQYWKRELRRRQEEYDNADSEEDDIGYLADQVTEAEEELREVKRWVRKAEDAKAEFDRCVARLLGDQNDKAVAFLRRKIQEMQDYLSTPFGQIEYVAPSAPAIMDNLLNAAEDVAARGVSLLTDYALPATIDWVPLSAISPKELAELPSDERYEKTSKAEIERGFFVLRNEILPTLQKLGKQADSDYFRAVDEKAGSLHEQGVLRVYEAFFGNDAIKLDRSLDGQHYDIINGSHRVKVALEQGWTHIPARTD